MKMYTNKFVEEFIKECEAEAKEMGFYSIYDAVVYLRKKQDYEIRK